MRIYYNILHRLVYTLYSNSRSLIFFISHFQYKFEGKEAKHRLSPGNCWLNSLVTYGNLTCVLRSVQLVNSKDSLEGLMLKLKLQYFGHPMQRTDALERPWCWERLKVGGERDDRGCGGWMASSTPWTWAWVNSGSWWWTGRPGVLQSMGSQKVGHDWEIELNWWWYNRTTELSIIGFSQSISCEPDPVVECHHIGCKVNVLFFPHHPMWGSIFLLKCHS